MDRVSDTGFPVARFLGPDGVVQRVRLAAYGWCEADGAVLALPDLAAAVRAAGCGRSPAAGWTSARNPRRGCDASCWRRRAWRASLVCSSGVRSAVLEPAETISGHRVQTVGILYRATVAGGRLRDEVDGSSDLARWVPFTELDALPVTALVPWARGVVGR